GSRFPLFNSHSAISPGGVIAVADGINDDVELFDLTSGEPLDQPEGLLGRGKTVSSLAFARSGKWLAVGGPTEQGPGVTLIDLATGKSRAFASGRKANPSVL